MPKITVIMPALNVVKYIESCMESVISQTLQDIEILAIDAGSDDGTLEILQKYAEADERVKVLHSDRKSYGYQLNMGIALAQGKYIGIVETDDIIVDNMYEVLYRTAEETEAEYVKGTAVYFVDIGQNARWQTAGRMPCKDHIRSGEVISPCDTPELLMQDIYLWTGIYRKDFLHGILFNETPGAAFQDQGFLFQTISKAKKAVYLNQPVYFYRQDNANSSIFNHKGFHYLVEEYSHIEQFLADKDAAWTSVYYRRMLNQILGRFRTMAVSGTLWEEANKDMEILRGRLTSAIDNGQIRLADMEGRNRELLTLLIKSVKAVYEECVREFRVKEETVRKILHVIEGHQVVIFGCGRLGRFFHALIEGKYLGVAVTYCDNNPELWDIEIQGMQVLSPEKAVEQYPEAVYVIANVKSAEAIKSQLQGMGIADKNICVYQGPVNMALFRMKYS